MVVVVVVVGVALFHYLGIHAVASIGASTYTARFVGIGTCTGI